MFSNIHNTHRVMSALVISLLCSTTMWTKDNGFTGWAVTMAQRTLRADGNIGAQKTVSIRCSKLLSGKGLVSAPEITIVANKFDFKGTIECSGKCIITTKDPFDAKMFTRKGEGQFIINIDPSLKFEEECWTFKGVAKTVALCTAFAAVAAAYDHYYGDDYTKRVWDYLGY